MTRKKQALNLSEKENREKFRKVVKQTFWVALGTIILFVAIITYLLFR